MHGDAARRIGAGLVSEDLVEAIAPVLGNLANRQMTPDSLVVR
jgi:hypothetical protein